MAVKKKKIQKKITIEKLMSDVIDGELFAAKASDPIHDVSFIPFGIPALDKILGGGVPRSRLTEIKGKESVGKTFLIQELIANAQRVIPDFVGIYFNCEYKFDPRWFKATGVDLDRLVVVNGNYGEKVLDSLIEAVENNVDLIIVDSVASLCPMVEYTDPMGKKQMGSLPSMMAKLFRKLPVPLCQSQTAIVFINQLRENLGMVWGDKEYSPGGRAYGHAMTIRMNVSRGEWHQTTKSDVTTREGFDIEVRTVKNNVSRAWMECAIPFDFSGKIDKVASLVGLATDLGLVKDRKKHFKFKDYEAYGQNKFLQIFRDDKHARFLLKKAIDSA